MMAVKGRKCPGGLVLLIGTVLLCLSGVLSVSISEVSVAKKEALPGIPKALSKISLPQVPVPEFPKFVSRPNKNPSSTSSSSGNSNKEPTSSSSSSQPSTSSSPSSHTQQQTPVVHQSFSQNQQVHNIAPSMSRPSLLQEHAELSNALQEEMLSDDDQEYQSGFTPMSGDNLNSLASSGSLSIKEPSPILHLPSLPSKPLLESATHPVPPVLSLTGKHETKNDTGKGSGTSTPTNTEKFQDAGDIPMPAHVMSILQALGSGGSLAQASKPEKDAGHGYTTANAIGYATGDNATVTASVSNKMEVNTQTVILTESATASASSLSNGTAFSQATLSSNGITNQLGGGGWPGPGNGWAKARAPSPNKKARKLRFAHSIVLPSTLY